MRQTKYYQQENIGDRWKLKRNLRYIVEWRAVGEEDGKTEREVFCSLDDYNGYDVSWVHKFADPEAGLREYLTHLPLHNVKIHIEER